MLASVVLLLAYGAPFVDTATTSTTTKGADEVIVIVPPELEPPPRAEPEPRPELSKVRTSIRLDARLSMDTAFDQAGEQIAELWLGGRFELEVDITKDLKAFVAPNILFVSALSKEKNDREVVYLNTPEARISYSFGPFDLRVGALVFSWGTSDLVAPIDVLNPYDYRRSFVAAVEDTKIPVPAAELVAHTGPLTIRGVVEPFFTPSRFYLTGWDAALIQPGLMTNFNVAALQNLLGASTLDDLGDRLLVTHRPSDRPDNATLGARATLDLGMLDVSLTVVHGWEPLPSITVNPDLVNISSILANSVAMNKPIPLDATLLDALGRVQDALTRGQTVFEGKYNRRNLFGFDSVLALDPFVLKLDVAYTLARTSYTQDYRPVQNPWLNTVLGAEYLSGSDLQIVVETFALTIFDLRSNYRLTLIEPRAPPPSTMDLAGRTIVLPGIAGIIRYNLLEGDLRFELAGVSTLSRQDILLMPSVHYRIDDSDEIAAGGTYIDGKYDGYGGAYHHNNEVFIKYIWSR